MKDFEALFTKHGGYFKESPVILSQKLFEIRAFLFDWDGVFNDGRKSESSSSDFSESISMGINMLRFSTYLKHGYNPLVYIITGEQNPSANYLANREHFDGVFYKVKHKIDALNYLKDVHSLQNENFGFFFDDILDLSLAKIVGFRGMIQNNATPLFTDYVKQNGLADYITANSGGQNGLREACELILALNGNFEETIQNRIEFSAQYKSYLEQRSTIRTAFFTVNEGSVQPVNHN